MSFNSIGIIGCGVVGNAVKLGMSHAFDVFVYDKFKNEGCKSVFDLMQRIDGPVFICVPTPMLPNGSCDTSIVHEIVNEIHNAQRYIGREVTVAIKSTVPPGTTKALQTRYNKICLCFNPEFLTERNANDDFKNQDRIIVGASGKAMWDVCSCYQRAFPDIPIWGCKPSEAEMAKYITNVHLAVKVSLTNEFKEIATAKGINYNKALEIALRDERLGKTHWDVPGPDGHSGFGGTCFPKDLNALISEAKQLGINPAVMEAAWQKNLEVRDL